MLIIKKLKPLLFTLGIFIPMADASEITNPYNLGSVPRHMQDRMKEVGCAPITNYYSEHYVVTPPFSHFSWPNYALLCEQKSKNNTLEYLLIIKFKPEHAYAKCDTTISINTKPYGIELSEQAIDASDFLTYKTDEPRQFKTKQPKLAIGVEGGVMEFICVNEEWLYRRVLIRNNNKDAHS